MTCSPDRRRPRGLRLGRRKAPLALLAVALAAGCSPESEQFCTLGAVIPSVDVDVSALPLAQEVCLPDDHCAPVRDGVANLASPLITNETEDVRLSVIDAEATVLAEAQVRLPRHFGNGFDCAGDGPQGTVTFGPDGGVAVSADTDGSGRTR